MRDIDRTEELYETHVFTTCEAIQVEKGGKKEMTMRGGGSVGVGKKGRTESDGMTHATA